MSLLELNSDSGVPLVQQIQQNLRDRILNEELPQGFKLPSIRQLSSDLGCSTGIVERAVTTLTAEGLLESEPRRGLFVRKPRSKRQKSSDIALVLPTLRLQQMGEIIRGIRDALSGTPYRLIIQSADSDFDDEVHILEYLDHSDLAGVIICPPTSDAYAEPIRRFAAKGTPIVQATHRLEGLGDVHTVCVDEFECGRNAISYLLDRGHRDIALLGFAAHSLHSRHMAEGVKAGLRRHRMTFDDLHRIEVDVLDLNDDAPWLNAQIAADAFLRRGRGQVTAMIGWSHFLTIGALRAAQHLEINVPDDLSLVSLGYDMQTFAMLQPAMTIVADPLRTVAERAALHLIQVIRDPAMPAQVIQIPPALVERDSVAVVGNVQESV